jgi:hypothetical protein
MGKVPRVDYAYHILAPEHLSFSFLGSLLVVLPCTLSTPLTFARLAPCADGVVFGVLDSGESPSWSGEEGVHLSEGGLEVEAKEWGRSASPEGR